MNELIRHVFQQALWLISTAAQLVASMGIGAKWMIMTARCMAFAILDLAYFLPHLVWYIFTPNIIRGVSYRSSRRTKMRNLEMFVQRQNAMQRRESRFLRRDSFTASPAAAAAAVAAARAASAAAANHGQIDLDTAERLAASLNPADGSFVNGLPVSVAEDLSHIAGNNSFDDAIGALQKLYQRRHEREELARESGSVPGSVSAAAGDAMPDVEGDSFTESDDEDEEDRRNLHNRAKLDIYLPVPLDSLFRFMDQERRDSEASHSSRSGAHAKGAPRLQRKKFPIIISVNGGAWIVGYSFWNFLIARVLTARGYVVFCPDYRNFPQTTMEGMTLDVSDAIAWVLKNAERYNGDLNDVTLLGQSAGAHLTMMSLLSQAQVSSYEAAKAASPDGNISIPAPSPVAYNVPRYNPRQSIKAYVGISGIYNIRGLVRHFDRRGLYRNVLHQIAGGKANLTRYSVLAYFDERLKHLTGEYMPDDLFEFMPKHISFLHGDNDRSAPVTESANLVYFMRHMQRDALVKAYQSRVVERKNRHPSASVIEFILVPGANHTDCIIEEPLCCRKSHVVEFLTLYKRADEERRALMSDGASSPLASSAGGGFSSVRRTTGLQLGVTSSEIHDGASTVGGGEDLLNPNSADEDAEHPVAPARRPDGILLSPMPAKQRPRLMRLASYICPF